MFESTLSVVTGAFGNTGRHITNLLLARGIRVKTLTDHPNRPHPFGAQVAACPFRFDAPDTLAASLQGADTLYNTYWARFSVGHINHDRAVANSRALIEAARTAGVRRVVQVTVTGASIDSPLDYFRGKGQVEMAVRQSGISYAILRPSMIFGPGCILVNNLAWMLRHFPIFAVPGSGEYKLSAIHVEDLARLAVECAQRMENEVADAIGPETLTFNDLLHLIADAIQSKAVLIHTHPQLALALATVTGWLVRDIVLQQWEIDAMVSGLLTSNKEPTGAIRLSDWIRENAAVLGRTYNSELARHYRA